MNNNFTQSRPSSNNFKAAIPSNSILWIVQNLSKFDLDWRNRVHVSEDDLANFDLIPAGSGIVLTPNHADEMDPRICFEISRRAQRRFVFMCNREAFSEIGGTAGWLLQRIGAFSVERGGHDVAAKQFATEVVLNGRDTLVIFPEGEIFYLNDSIQPFHSGAFEIGIQAIIERRKQSPQWTTFLLPMSIKYKYRDPVHEILDEKISRMEQFLSKGMTGFTLQSRADGVLAELIREKEMQLNLTPDEKEYAKLALRLADVRHAILRAVGEKHKNSYREQARTIDQSFQLAAELHKRMAQTQNSEHKADYIIDLAKLKEVEHLVSLNPGYADADPHPERLAELVIKLERELFGIKRPKQMAKRDVFIRIGKPIDLGAEVQEYLEAPHVVRHRLAESLRGQIQGFIDQSH